MTHPSRWILVAATFSTLALAVPPALAEDTQEDAREDARKALINGYELYERAQYTEALSQIVTSWNLIRVPYTAVWAARANEKLGRLTHAAKMYREAIALAPDDAWPADPKKLQAQKQAQVDAQVELDALAVRIPSVSIEIIGGSSRNLTVAVDANGLASGDVSKAQELDPGSHTVSVTINAGKTLTARVTLAEGERKVVKFNLEQTQASVPPSIAEPTKRTGPSNGVVSHPRGHVASHQPDKSNEWNKLPTVSWVGVGVGLVGIAVGAAAYGIASAKRGEGNCNSDGYCDKTWYDQQRDDYYRWRTVHRVGLVVGGVGLATAAVAWVVVNSHSESSPQIHVAFGPGAVGVQTTF